MRRYLVLSLLFGLLLAGCGGGAEGSRTGARLDPAGAETSCPDAPGALSGPIVVSQATNLASIKPDGSAALQLTNLPAGVSAADPAWSPDGQTLAYTLMRPSRNEKLPWKPWSMICGLDRQSGKARVLALGEQPSDVLEHPAWSPDGQALLLTFRRAGMTEQGAYQGDITELSRYELGSGQRTALAAEGTYPALSHDGSKLSYLQLDPQTALMRLMIAHPSGSGARELLAGQPGFLLYAAPRWSPDGRQIVFNATDLPNASTATPESDSRSLLRQILEGPIVSAHGEPANLWLVDADGGNLRRLSSQPLDDPRAAWSPDGSQLAYVSGLGGVSLLTLASGQEQRLSELGGMGGIAWATR